MDQPRAGIHYPKSVGEFQAWFASDADGLDYLERLRDKVYVLVVADGRRDMQALLQRRLLQA